MIFNARTKHRALVELNRGGSLQLKISCEHHPLVTGFVFRDQAHILDQVYR